MKGYEGMGKKEGFGGGKGVREIEGGGKGLGIWIFIINRPANSWEKVF